MSKIAVIVPVYNVEQYLQKCINSILAQTFKDISIVLIDDGSTDNCPLICDKFAETDSRVTIIHQENKGLSAARNTGIDWVFSNSKCQWITFVDSDDWLHPQFLERLYNAAIGKNVSVSLCNYNEAINENTGVDVVEVPPVIFAPEDYYIEERLNATVAWGKLYKSECFYHIKYPINKIHEDEFVTYRILFSFDKICVINQPLYNYRITPNSITNRKWNLKRLDGILAQYEQLLYFKQNNFTKALDKYTTSFLYWLLDQKKLISEAELSVLEKKKAHKFIKSICRKTLLKFRKRLPFSVHRYFYDFAFPNFMRFYWLISGVRNKIGSVLGEKNDKN